MATQVTPAASGAAGAAVASAAGVDPSIGQAAGQAAGGSSGLCNCCCGNSSAAGQQKAAIAAANPPTGNPAVDNAPGGANDVNNKAFQAWQASNDVHNFDQLPASTKAQLPAVVDFVKAFKSKIPAADMNLTLAQAAAKYPDLAQQAYAQVQQIFPELQNVPLATAMALAKASGADQSTLSDLDTRLTNLINNDPTAKQIMAGSSSGGTGLGTIALWGGLAAGAVLLAKKLSGR